MSNIIFSIPIYTCDETEFNKRLIKSQGGIIEKAIDMGETLTGAKDFFCRRSEGTRIWKNYIVGYLDVTYNLGELNYDLYMMYSRKYLTKKVFSNIEEKI